VAAIEVSRETCLLGDTAKQRYQAAGVDAVLSKIAPTIHLPKHRPARNASYGDPVDIRLYRAKLLEGRGVE